MQTKWKTKRERDDSTSQVVEERRSKKRKERYEKEQEKSRSKEEKVKSEFFFLIYFPVNNLIFAFLGKTDKKLKKCGECMGCYRIEDCGRCDVCTRKGKHGSSKTKERCKLRICVNALSGA